jgi:hypothetical protein
MTFFKEIVLGDNLIIESLNISRENFLGLNPIEEINNESFLENCSGTNSKNPFSSEIIPLLLEKNIVANGTGSKEIESIILTFFD